MKIRKADIILAVVIAIIGIIASVYLTLHDTDVRNGQVVVYVDSELYGKYLLDEDQEIEVKQGDHINKITIKDGNAQMTFANCHNQDCVKQGKINDMSKSIICLPHKVVVEIQSDDRKYDAVSG